MLDVLEEEITQKCPDCVVRKATNYEEAIRFVGTGDYDVVILDIMGVRGFDLLEAAVSRGLRVVMLTAHALTPEALKRSHDMGARAYLPKEKLGEVVPFLEDALSHEFVPGWKRLMDRMEDHFNEELGPDWKIRSGAVSW